LGSTPEGVSLGTGRESLIDVYGSAVSIVDDTALDTATFAVVGIDQTLLETKLDRAGAGGMVDFLEPTPSCEQSSLWREETPLELDRGLAPPGFFVEVR
jgi:hypothetical protein